MQTQSKSNPAPTSITGIPLIAIGRAVERKAVTWYRRVLLSRLLVFVGSFVVVVLGAFDHMPDRIAVASAVAIIVVELSTNLILIPKATHINHLARSILQREVLVAAGYLTEASPGTAALKNQADEALPSACADAHAWLSKRVGKKSDGSDYHTTNEVQPSIRLLDILFENYSWWSLLARRTAARYAIVVTIAVALVAAGILLPILFPIGASLSVPIALTALNGFLLFSGLSIIQELLKWRGAAAMFEIKRAELTNLLRVRDDDIGELHAYATTYALLTTMTGPVPVGILSKEYEAIDRRVTAELGERERRRKAAKSGAP